MKMTKGLGIGLLVGGFTFIGAAFASQPSAPNAKVIEVQDVQAAIAANHANWQAKENWVSKLSRADAIRMMGLKGPLPQGRLEFESVRSKDATAQVLDWRNVNGIDWTGPAMNQGNCGSCVAFSTIATLTAQTAISSGLPWLSPTFSPQELFACGGGSCDQGWEPNDAAAFLQSTGVTDEACMPYTSGSTGNDVDCSQRCADAASRTTKIIGSSTPTNGWGGSVDAVKQALTHGPLITTLTVYGDFVTYAGGVYKHVAGDALGGHAISIVGFDDNKRAWIIRNSWGPEWGENGYGYMSWDDESGVGGATNSLEVGTPQGYVSVTSPTDSEYVSGQYKLNAAVAGAAHSADVQFHVVGAGGRDVEVLGCAGVNAQACAAILDTTKMGEGVYNIYAMSPSTGIRSQTRQFTVINSVPRGLSLQMVPKDGVDLTKPLNGRPEFIVTANAAPVQFQEVEFRAFDMKGNLASVKTNTYVLPQMDMGWRTMTVPDGQYKILFHGEITYQGHVYGVDSNSYTITVQN